MDGQRVDAALEFHDIDPVMGLPAWTVPGMTFVLVGFVQNVQAFRGKSRCQLLYDDIFCLHAGSLNGSRRARSMAAICAGGSLRQEVTKSSLEGAARTSE
jgi:hypothetical protein